MGIIEAGRSHPHSEFSDKPIAFLEIMSDAPLSRFDAMGIGGMAPLTRLQGLETVAMFLFMGLAFYLAWRWR